MSAHDDSLPGCDSEGHCITCSDEGAAMRVLEVDRERSLAVCAAPEGGATDETTGDEEVAIDLVEPVAHDDLLLVHAGVALANLGKPNPNPILTRERVEDEALAGRRGS